MSSQDKAIVFSLSLLMIDRAETSPARGTTKHAVPAANNDQDSIQALTVFAITFCGKSIAFNAFEQRLRKLFVNFMKLINLSWRALTTFVISEGLAVRRSSSWAICS